MLLYHFSVHVREPSNGTSRALSDGGMHAGPLLKIKLSSWSLTIPFISLLIYFFRWQPQWYSGKLNWCTWSAKARSARPRSRWQVLGSKRGTERSRHGQKVQLHIAIVCCRWTTNIPTFQHKVSLRTQHKHKTFFERILVVLEKQQQQHQQN